MKEKISLSNHPAVIAWKKINTRTKIPLEIEVLKKRNNSKVFRLLGIGPDNQHIIAKGGKFKNLLPEQIIYEKILPACQFFSLKYFGLVKNEEEDLSWIFLEDGIGDKYDSANKDHRMAVIHWLGNLHNTSLSDEKIALLPDRSLNCYYEYLQDARTNILENLNNPSLTKDNIDLIKDIERTLERISLKWKNLKSFCEPIPQTLVHGDFTPRNFKIYNYNSKFSLVPFDWEMGGWGVSSIDVGSLRFNFNKEELRQYWSIVNFLQASLSFDEKLHFIQIGRILRLVVSVYWVTLYLKFSWLKRPMRNMYVYQKHFSRSFKSLGW